MSIDSTCSPDRGRGRPTSCRPRTVHRILEGIELGLPPGAAASRAGIDPTTAARWVQRGERERERLNLQDEWWDSSLADWVDQFPHGHEEDNPMWNAAPPAGANLREWPFLLFLQLQSTFSAEVEVAALAELLAAGAAGGRWRPAAHFLERRFPERWGRRCAYRPARSSQ